MTRLSPPRFETHRPMLVAGIRRHHRFTGVESTVPEQWRETRALPPIPGRTGEGVAYGVVCGSSEEGFEYLSGVEVESFEGVPAGLGRVRVPAQHYAVFTHEGHVAALGETWRAIWEDWLPASGRTPAQTPDFERYDGRFDPRSGEGVVEIWFPVTEPPES